MSLSPFLGAGNPRRLAPLRRVHLTSTGLSSIQSAYTSVEPLSVSLLYHRRGVWYTNPLVAPMARNDMRVQTVKYVLGGRAVSTTLRAGLAIAAHDPHT